MASSESEKFAITPSSTRFESTAKPNSSSRVLKSPLSDEVIWKKLNESGFNEESIKKADKAKLIAHITKLEKQIYDHQHHMGLLILERKEWASKYDQMNASAESAKLKYKCDQAAYSSAMAEARKREDNLKQKLGVKEECIKNIEKALHEMRTESAETKVAAECKLAEARSMVEEAQKKFAEAEAQLLAAEALQTDANRNYRTAERKLNEVEAREDDLRRRIMSLKSDGDAKEKEILVERQSLSERQRILQQEQERILDGQALLNQREDYIFNKTQELSHQEKELEASKMNIDKERRALKEEISNLELNKASLSAREEAVIEKETMLNKKEQELLILQEKIACKESDDVQKLMADHETALRKRASEFDAELETKCKSVEDEIESKRRAWELREVDLRQREDLFMEREQDLEAQSRALLDKESDMVEKLNSLEEKEKNLDAVEKEVELKKTLLQKEQEDVKNMKLELQKSFDSLEERSKQIDHAKNNVEAMKSETNGLLILETKLKEEIDMVRAQKLEVMARADELKMEKAKFEAEWEAIDEKREELRKEAERIAEERVTISKFLKDERDCMKLEKDLMREEYKRDVDSLRHEREEFMNKMVHEHSEWFNKIQQERADFLMDIEMQKRELENLVDKRREELESHFMEKEKSFELEKKRELENMSSLKETVAKDLEHVASEMKRLDTERSEIKQDRERRDREWAELNNSIEELKMQRQKLKKQRESLHADRAEMDNRIEQLKKLEELEIARQSTALAAMLQSDKTVLRNAGLDSIQKLDAASNSIGHGLHHLQSGGSPDPAPVSWLKRCAKLIFKQSPETAPTRSEEPRLPLARQLDLSNGFYYQTVKAGENTQKDIDEQQPKEVLKLPLSDKDINKTHNLETDVEAGTREFSSNGYTDEELVAGRKRKNDNPSSYDLCDTEAQEGKNKKRRQRKDATETPSEPSITHCVVSTGSSVLEEMSLNQTSGTLVIDRVVNIVEHARVHTDNDITASQDKLVCSQNFIDEGILEHGGTNGHAEPSLVENCEKTHEMLQEPLVDGGQSDRNELWEGSFSNKSNQTIKNHSVVESSDKEKNKEQIGIQMRSKQKK